MVSIGVALLSRRTAAQYVGIGPTYVSSFPAHYRVCCYHANSVINLGCHGNSVNSNVVG